MERLDPARISDIIARSPVWARLALTSNKPALVERAADALAARLVAKLAEPEPPVIDARQLPLPALAVGADQ